MKHHVQNRILELLQGDITDQQVDAIVNAANSQLAGGGGVDGAIHRRGGPQIMAETRRRYPDGCPTGSAVISTAGNLNAKYVIHAVGPIWRDGNRGERESLEHAYRSCLQLADRHACTSIAFPSLSTGAYRFPIEAASRIAVGTAAEHLQEAATTIQLIRFVLFDEPAFAAFAVAVDQLPDLHC